MQEKTGHDVFSCSELVWTKLSYTMGFVSPSLNIDDEENIIFQKAFIDQMWEISLAHIVDNLASSANKDKIPTIPDISQILNDGKTQHQNENNSFEQMFLSELAGLIDVYKPQFASLIPFLHQKETGVQINPTDDQNKESSRLIGNIIYNLFRLKKIDKELPTFRVSSGLHAATRWDKARKFKKNDMHDFKHAVAAIPYCDFFLTERSLCHLASQKLLRYNELYGCVILSNVQDSYQKLSKI